jgi:hypothetical protein
MGLLDHRRQWHYLVKATPGDCVGAFLAAFNGRGGLVTKAHWKVRINGNSATAIDKGRKGLGAVMGSMSRTSSQETDTAIGSTVEFQATADQSRRTSCSMALTSAARSGVAGILGATSDARFIRPYMQAVASEMRKLDQDAQISTD